MLPWQLGRLLIFALLLLLLLARPAEASRTRLLESSLRSPLTTKTVALPGAVLDAGGGADDGGLHCLSMPLEWFSAWIVGGIGGYGLGALVAIILGVPSSDSLGYAIYTISLLVLRPLGDAMIINFATRMFDSLKSNFWITAAADAAAGLVMFAVTGWNPDNGIGVLLVAPIAGVLAANYGPPGSGNGLLSARDRPAARPIAVAASAEPARTRTATLLAFSF